MKPSNPPRKHHFIPAFYLSEWASAHDGQLERFRRSSDGIVRAKRLAPAGLGWHRDLYRAPGEHSDPWKAQALETDFFGPLDNAAQRCMARLNSGDLNEWTSAQRTDWAMFLLSLFHRQPEHLAATMVKLRGIYSELIPDMQIRYDELRGHGDPLLFEDWERDNRPDYLDHAAFQLLPTTIDNKKVGEFIINTQWGVIDLTGSDHPLLISDNPIIFRPLKLEMGHIAIPISPFRLFVAAEDKRLFAHLKAEGPKRIVRTANHVVVGNANTFVGAVDRSSETYIAKHFGTWRLGSVAAGFAQASA